MTQDDGGCWGKDDVTFLNMILGENFKQFDLIKLVLLQENEFNYKKIK